MNSKRFALMTALSVLSFSPIARAQFGMDMIKKPSIGNVFHPVVGSGGVYEVTDRKGEKTTLEMSILAKDSVDGKTAYWMEIGHVDKKTSDKMMYGKSLITFDDMQTHRAIYMMPGSDRPFEMEMHPSSHAKIKEHGNSEMGKWHSVGTESITVPAGTFSCEHWNGVGPKGGDVWISSKVSPMGIVKSVDRGETMVLTRVITNAKGHITGTPKKMDAKAMGEQMMKQMQNHR